MLPRPLLLQHTVEQQQEVVHALDKTVVLVALQRLKGILQQFAMLLGDDLCDGHCFSPCRAEGAPARSQRPWFKVLVLALAWGREVRQIHLFDVQPPDEPEQRPSTAHPRLGAVAVALNYMLYRTVDCAGFTHTVRPLVRGEEWHRRLLVNEATAIGGLTVGSYLKRHLHLLGVWWVVNAGVAAAPEEALRSRSLLSSISCSARCTLAFTGSARFRKTHSSADAPARHVALPSADRSEDSEWCRP